MKKPHITNYEVQRFVSPVSGKEQVHLVLDAAMPRRVEDEKAVASMLLSEIVHNPATSPAVRRLQKRVFAAVTLVLVSSYLRRWASK